jgi:hypothetical protein
MAVVRPLSSGLMVAAVSGARNGAARSRSIRGNAWIAGRPPTWHTRAGSRQWILDSFAEWHRLFGVPPAAGDWNPSRARRMTKRPDDYFGRTLARHDSTGRRWPSTTLVANHFGTWNAALSAAGFEPLTPNQYWIGRRKLAVMA